MPSTSVQLPDSLLEDLNHLAAETGRSRDRLIVEACRARLRQSRQWPSDFFDNARFRPEELEDLRSHAEVFESELVVARRNRNTSPI